MKREARTYSNADLSGKWIVGGFGDSAGTNGFDTDPPPNSRLVMIGIRCNDFAIPLVYHLPLILRN